MITEDEQPVWYEYIEYDKDFNPYLRDNAPEDVRKAYEEYQREIEEMTRNGEKVYM